MFATTQRIVVSVLLMLVFVVEVADARVIRIDRQIGFIDGTELANDGSKLIPILGQEEDFDTGERSDVPFRINFFGTEYDSLYVNENGIVSFGAPFSAIPSTTPDVFNAGIPVIAPFFADADMTAPRFEISPGNNAIGRVNIAFTFGVNMFLNFSSTYQGSTGTPALQNQTQIAFFGSQTSTDFTLELNYGEVQWESGDADGGTNGLGGIAPRIGFSNGFGLTYEIPGSGMNGTLLSEAFPDNDTCAARPMSVGCNDYTFQFIDGIPYIDGERAIAVPEPSTIGLFGFAMLWLAFARRRARDTFNGRRLIALLPLVVVLCIPTLSSARVIRIDQTLAFCTVDVSAGASLDIGHPMFGPGDSSQCNDSSLFDPFSVKLGDTTYDSLFLNNDGLITFGSLHDGSMASLADPSFGAAFAPFFTNTSFVDSVSSGTPRVSWGGTVFSTEPYLSINYEGGNSDSYYQVNIIDRSADTGLAGDFDLEFSYFLDSSPGSGVMADQGGAQVGFNNGAGQTFLAEGSGVAGAFIGGGDECGNPGVSAFALACTGFDDTESGFVFEFRNGLAVNLPQTNAVPEPGTMGLLLFSILALFGARRARA